MQKIPTEKSDGIYNCCITIGCGLAALSLCDKRIRDVVLKILIYLPISDEDDNLFLPVYGSEPPKKKM